jgi:hypothetical protein
MSGKKFRHRPWGWARVPVDQALTVGRSLPIPVREFSHFLAAASGTAFEDREGGPAPGPEKGRDE